MVDDVSPTIEADDPPWRTVIAAFSHPGMAGVIACNYLLEELDLEETGHVRAEGLPAVAPFVDGRPYHPTRFHSRDDLDVTVLTSELPVPLHFNESFGQRVLEWFLDHVVGEVTALLGIPDVKDPVKGVIYYAASEDYADHRLQDASYTPIGGGFFDGVNASLISGDRHPARDGYPRHLH